MSTQTHKVSVSEGSTTVVTSGRIAAGKGNVQKIAGALARRSARKRKEPPTKSNGVMTPFSVPLQPTASSSSSNSSPSSSGIDQNGDPVPRDKKRARTFKPKFLSYAHSAMFALGNWVELSLKDALTADLICETLLNISTVQSMVNNRLLSGGIRLSVSEVLYKDDEDTKAAFDLHWKKVSRPFLRAYIEQSTRYGLAFLSFRPHELWKGVPAVLDLKALWVWGRFNATTREWDFRALPRTDRPPQNDEEIERIDMTGICFVVDTPPTREGHLKSPVLELQKEFEKVVSIWDWQTKASSFNAEAPVMLEKVQNTAVEDDGVNPRLVEDVFHPLQKSLKGGWQSGHDGDTMPKPVRNAFSGACLKAYSIRLGLDVKCRERDSSCPPSSDSGDPKVARTQCLPDDYKANAYAHPTQDIPIVEFLDAIEERIAANFGVPRTLWSDKATGRKNNLSDVGTSSSAIRIFKDTLESWRLRLAEVCRKVVDLIYCEELLENASADKDARIELSKVDVDISLPGLIEPEVLEKMYTEGKMRYEVYRVYASLLYGIPEQDLAETEEELSEKQQILLTGAMPEEDPPSGSSSSSSSSSHSSSKRKK